MGHFAGFGAGECGEFGVGLSACQGVERLGVRPGGSQCFLGWKTSLRDKMLQDLRCAPGGAEEPLVPPLPRRPPSQ